MRDVADFEAFYLDNYTALVRLLTLVVGNRSTAEDLAQDTFVKLYSRLFVGRSVANPHAWIRTVAIHKAYRTRRAASVTVVSDQSNMQQMRDLDLLNAVNALPRMQRIAVILHYFEDLPARDIATMLRRSESTIRVNLLKARRRLQESLGGVGRHVV